MNKAPGLPGALHLDCFYVVAFSAENRQSTFPENALFAWSHFLRKTGSPLFRKMLLLPGRIFCGKPEIHFPENAPVIRSRGPRSRGADRGARSDRDRHR